MDKQFCFTGFVGKCQTIIVMNGILHDVLGEQ